METTACAFPWTRALPTIVFMLHLPSSPLLLVPPVWQRPYFQVKTQQNTDIISKREREKHGSRRLVRRRVRDMATGTHNSTTTNPIMLRFRPILPKPAAEGALSALGNQNAVSSKRRFKRKYVRARRTYGRKNGKSGKLETPRSPELGNAAVVTLPLLPEKAQLNEVITGKNFNINEKVQIHHGSGPTRVSAEARGEVSDKVAAAAKSTVEVESWVTVESVTATCMGEGEVGGLFGCTDVERVKVLETDTCPGFVSDGYCRVRWVNNAFKRMVVSDDEEMGEPLPEVVVWLKLKDNAVRRCYSYLAFTCGVRLQYTWRNEKCKKMVPCDVWRLDCGGFAWRLDVKAALSLGI